MCVQIANYNLNSNKIGNLASEYADASIEAEKDLNHKRSLLDDVKRSRLTKERTEENSARELVGFMNEWMNG